MTSTVSTFEVETVNPLETIPGQRPASLSKPQWKKLRGKAHQIREKHGADIELIKQMTESQRRAAIQKVVNAVTRRRRAWMRSLQRIGRIHRDQSDVNADDNDTSDSEDSSSSSDSEDSNDSDDEKGSNTPSKGLPSLIKGKPLGKDNNKVNQSTKVTPEESKKARADREILKHITPDMLADIAWHRHLLHCHVALIERNDKKSSSSSVSTMNDDADDNSNDGNNSNTSSTPTSSTPLPNARLIRANEMMRSIVEDESVVSATMKIIGFAKKMNNYSLTYKADQKKIEEEKKEKEKEKEKEKLKKDEDSKETEKNKEKSGSEEGNRPSTDANSDSDSDSDNEDDDADEGNSDSNDSDDNENSDGDDDDGNDDSDSEGEKKQVTKVSTGTNNKNKTKPNDQVISKDKKEKEVTQTSKANTNIKDKQDEDKVKKEDKTKDKKEKDKKNKNDNDKDADKNDKDKDKNLSEREKAFKKQLQKLDVGTVLRGVINNVLEHGYFVTCVVKQFAISGYCPRSEADVPETVRDLRKYKYKRADRVTAVVTSIDPETKKMSLSFKAEKFPVGWSHVHVTPPSLKHYYSNQKYGGSSMKSQFVGALSGSGDPIQNEINQTVQLLQRLGSVNKQGNRMSSKMRQRVLAEFAGLDADEEEIKQKRIRQERIKKYLAKGHTADEARELALADEKRIREEKKLRPTGIPGVAAAGAGTAEYDHVNKKKGKGSDRGNWGKGGMKNEDDDERESKDVDDGGDVVGKKRSRSSMDDSDGDGNGDGDDGYKAKRQKKDKEKDKGKEKSVHPSWIAKQKAEALQAATKFQGTKVKFD